MINRDESPLRPEAMPPAARLNGPNQTVWPMDPPSGGTWVAVSQAGLAMALLNLAPGRGPAAPVRAGSASRGAIIPSLLHARSLGEAAADFARLDLERVPPFRLIMASRTACLEFVAPGYGEVAMRLAHPLEAPVMFASSGLGDALVDQPRRELFRGWALGSRAAWPAAQEAFHRSQWTDRPALSVRMSRPGARTVSRTTIDLHEGTARMQYEPERDGFFIPGATITISTSEREEHSA